jgi:dienelactone hydrolase
LAPAAAPSLKAKILVLHGALDPFIKTEELQAFTRSLDEAKADYQFVSYSGAVHAFTNPQADKIAAATGLKGIGYHEPAARRSWAQMRAFFSELFPKPKS